MTYKRFGVSLKTKTRSAPSPLVKARFVSAEAPDCEKNRWERPGPFSRDDARGARQLRVDEVLNVQDGSAARCRNKNTLAGGSDKDRGTNIRHHFSFFYEKKCFF
ncbi:MAG: hypothetical protein ACI399_05955 [Candidatus Cryptobacteroides sp.]